MNSIHEFIRSRRSIRRFKPDSLPEDVIDRILTTATFAASAHNRQPWRFATLTQTDVKSRLAEAMAVDFRRDLEKDKLPETEIHTLIDRSRRRITSAPAVIVLSMDASEMDVYPDRKRAEAERLMAIQSTANAGMLLLLAAQAEGLGAVWTCAPLFAPDVVRIALDLPQAWEPQAMFFIGYSAENPKIKDMKPLREISIRVS